MIFIDSNNLFSYVSESFTDLISMGQYKSTYFAALCFEVWLPRFTRLPRFTDPPRQLRQRCELRQPLSLSISRLSCILSLSVAAKHDSRNIKNNLKLILGFLDRGCRVSQLPGNTISSLYHGCRKVPQQVEIRFPRRSDTHAIIRSPLVSRFLFCLIYKIVVRSSK